MKFFKWFKKDSQRSPVRLGKRHLSESLGGTASSVTGVFCVTQKAGLSRNESYLKALAKFNNWRQLHISNDNQKLKKARMTSRSSDRLHCNALYDEVNEKNRKFGKNFSVCTEHISYENSLARIEMEDTEFSTLEEPEYAVPFQYSNVLEVVRQGQRDQAYMAYEDLCFDHTERLQDKLMVTDLDKSAHEIDLLKNANAFSSRIDDKSSSYDCIATSTEIFSGLLVCLMKQIKWDKQKACFEVSSGNVVQHGSYDDIEISLIKGGCLNSIWNNLEKLRNLRHRNIVLLMGVSIDENSRLTGLLLEPLGESLYNLIHIKKYRYSMEKCRQYGVQLADAAIYLHKHNIIHSHICTGTVLLTAHAGLKLGNFDVAVKLGNIESGDGVNSLDQGLIQSTEYRKKYTWYNYESPELLSDTDAMVQPTIQADVYGICITLWELLNCVIAYHQFSYAELVKVFSLQNAQLPIYEAERYNPYKNILENGLEIRLQNRTPTVNILKQAISNVEFVESQTTDDNAGKQFNNYAGEYFWESNKHIKDISGDNLKNLLVNNELNLDESDDWRTSSTIGISQCNVKHAVVPNEKNLKRSFQINGKCSVNILVRNISSRCEETFPYDNQRNIEYREVNPLVLNDMNWNPLLPTNSIINQDYKTPTFIISTEDEYIDDGFSDGFGMGANMSLGLNATSQNM